jgi:hypothetical protein
VSKPGPSLLDPLALWRDALTQWEGRTNSLANEQMGSEEFTRAMHLATNLSQGMQQTFGKVVGRTLKNLNLPSRTELVEIDHRLQRIEETLAALVQQLQTAEHGSAPPVVAMPPRTRKPAAPASAPPAVEAPRPIAAKKAPTRRAGRAR